MTSEEFIAQCKTYCVLEKEFTPVEALTLLTQAYMDQCGISMTFRTLVEGAGLYWLKRLSESDHELAKFASKHSFTQLMPYLSEEFNARKEHYWEYDICNLDSETAIDAAQCYMTDIEDDDRLTAVFAIGFADYLERLIDFERDWNKIVEESKEEKRASRIKELQEHLLELESEIKSLVGDDPDLVYIQKYFEPSRKKHAERFSQTRFERLGELSSERCVLLNNLFQATEEEMTHLRRVNDHLLSLRNSLHLRTSTMKRTIVADPDFDDDYEIEGRLSFHYNGEDSVLKLDNDSFYGSDFRLMASVLEAYYTALGHGNIGLPIAPDETNTLDDGQSWSNGPFNSKEFDDIVIGYALHDLCHNEDYSLPDLVRLNDFWAEVVVKVQSITTQSGERFKTD